MDKTIESMKKAYVKPALFPHWLHRIRYKCKTCHGTIFIMEKGANSITMQSIMNGEHCGKCHNGDIAFTTKDCDKCHLLDSREAVYKRLIPIEKMKEYEWYQERLKGRKMKVPAGMDKDGIKFMKRIMAPDESLDHIAFRKLERDKFGLVDWAKAIKQRKIAPVVLQLGDKKVEEKIYLRPVLLKTKNNSVPQVLFPHDLHSYWLLCESCHDKLFPKNPEQPYMKMRDFQKGKWCGKCHGKVSFPATDCKRCHSVPLKQEME